MGDNLQRVFALCNIYYKFNWHIRVPFADDIHLPAKRTLWQDKPFVWNRHNFKANEAWDFPF